MTPTPGRRPRNSEVVLLPRISEKESLLILEDFRWPNGVACPRCAGSRVIRFQARNGVGRLRMLYDCRSCGYQYSATAGTMFHGSHLPLSKWLQLLWLLSESPAYPPGRRIQEIIGVPYKTAWSITNRIEEANREPLRDYFAPTGSEARVFEPSAESKLPKPSKPHVAGDMSIDALSFRLRQAYGSPNWLWLWSPT